MRLSRQQAEQALNSPAGKLILATLRRRQIAKQEEYRTCKPEQLIGVQSQDSLLEEFLSDDFKNEILDTYDEIKMRQNGS